MPFPFPFLVPFFMPLLNVFWGVVGYLIGGLFVTVEVRPT